MIYLIIAIIIFTIIETYLLDDFLSILRLNSIITIVSGYITIILNNILNNAIKKEISFINISKVTNIVLKKTINRGLILVLIGTIELIIYIIIYIYKKRRTINK